MNNTIKVLIVDDSPSVRSLLRAIIEQAPQLLVCGEVSDAFEARSAIKQLQPDVITLDIEMPKMNGIMFLRNLMRLHPLPTVMISTLTHAGSDAEIEALALGAVDVIHKPNSTDIDRVAEEIVRKVTMAADANVSHYESALTLPAAPGDDEQYRNDSLILVGASTGGVPAIETLVSGLPINCPPVVIALHIPAGFSKLFAHRINNKYPVQISEASDQQIVVPGCVYLAPGDHHLELVKRADRYRCRLHQGPQVHFQRPAVDNLFSSVAKVCNGNACAALLTGMGQDGAGGLLQLKQKGCFTVIQNQATSVVWGMPGAAAALRAETEIAPLNRISWLLLDSCRVKGDRYERQKDHIRGG